MKKLKFFIIGTLVTIMSIPLLMGQTWEQVAIPVELSQHAIGMHFIDNAKIFIEYSSSSVYESEYLGQNWAQIATGVVCSPSTAHKWYFYDELNGFFPYSCAGAGLGHHVIKTLDGGNTWQAVSSNIEPNIPYCYPFDGFSGINKVYFTDQLNGYTISDWNNMLVTSDGAATWQSQCLVIEQSGVYIHMKEIAIQGNVGFLLALDAGGAGAYIYRTTNGGGSWSNWAPIASKLFGRDFKKIYFHNENTVFICGTAGKVLRSFDNGNTFDTLTTNPSGTLYDMKFFDNLNGLMVGAAIDGGQLTFRSEDGGQSWYQANVPGHDLPFYWVEQGPDGTVYLGGEWSASDGYIFKSDFMTIGIEEKLQNPEVNVYVENKNILVFNPVTDISGQQVNVEIFSVEGKLLFVRQIYFGQTSQPTRISTDIRLKGLVIVKLTGRDFCQSKKLIF